MEFGAMSNDIDNSVHPRCAIDFSTAWINGRSLAKSLKTTKAKHSFATFSPTDRVKVELPRDTYALGIELVHAAPLTTF